MAAGQTYTPITSTTLGSSQSSVNFTSIAQTYTDLVLVVSAKVSSATYDITAMSINGITSGYSKTYLQGDGSSALSGRQTAEIRLRGGYLPGTNYSNEFSVDTYHFMNYSNTTTYKTVLCRLNAYNTVNLGFNTQAQVCLIPTTSAITSISIATANGANLYTNSTFTLYGITAA